MYKYATLFLIVVFFSACQSDTSQHNFQVKTYPNILNNKGIPDSTTDRSISIFSDLGAWQAYALIDDSTMLGGFAGPHLIQENIWLSKSLSRLWIFDIEKKEKLSLDQAEIIDNSAYSGILKQRLKIDDIIVELQLCFANNQTALIKATIENPSRRTRQFRIAWIGDFLHQPIDIQRNERGFTLKKIGKRASFQVSPITTAKVHLNYDSASYHMMIDTIYQLEASKNVTNYVAQTLFFNPRIQAQEEQKLQAIISNPESIFLANETRWSTYLQKIIPSYKGFHKEEANRRVAVKCLQTLVNNWRSPRGQLKHDGLFPSYAPTYFHGFWAWDSWKHSVAIASFDTQLAQNQIRAMFDFQNQYGMIADCIFPDITIEKHNWRDTKPPLSAWAVWEVYQTSKDNAFLLELFPKLLKYHNWWYYNRDHDGNKLCEYGSTDGTRIAAAWESGMDNAVRFDSATMVKNSEQAWSLNQESVDLNSYLYAEKIYLAHIAQALKKKGMADSLRQEASVLKTMIQEQFFDETDGYFYDKKLKSTDLIKVQGPEGWIPLWAGVATKEQAKKIIAVLKDKKRFSTHMPFPTLSNAHAKFNPKDGYWRGPVWLDQAYFAIEGMKRYGYRKDSQLYIKQLINNSKGLKNSTDPIYENYHPLTGKGLNSPHFSWSAAHFLLLYQ